MKENEIRQRVSLGALLHDIGKFWQRADAEGEKELSKQSKEMETLICPLIEGRYKYRHVLYTNEFFERKEYNSIFPVNIIEGKPDNCANLSSYHHKPSTKLQKIIQSADRLSAGMDRQPKADEEEGEKVDFRHVRLQSIFHEIELITTEKGIEGVYELNSLSLNREVIFPKRKHDSSGSPRSQGVTYSKLWGDFIKEFKQLPKDNFRSFFNSLYYLLWKYTWCIPSSTKDLPDISLFDHLKTTSAIALCLYDWSKNRIKEQSKPEDQQKKFVLLGGDITGIQNFIYRITQAQGVGGISKRLRGRSFYISLLTEVVAKYLIEELCVNITHLIFCGGGRFTILLPNIPQVLSKVEQSKRDINVYLLKNFYGELGVILATIECTEAEIKDYGRMISYLANRIDEAKKIKFFDLWNGPELSNFLKA